MQTQSILETVYQQMLPPSYPLVHLTLLLSSAVDL